MGLLCFLLLWVWGMIGWRECGDSVGVSVCVCNFFSILLHEMFLKVFFSPFIFCSKLIFFTHTQNKAQLYRQSHWIWNCFSFKSNTTYCFSHFLGKSFSQSFLFSFHLVSIYVALSHTFTHWLTPPIPWRTHNILFYYFFFFFSLQELY